MYHNFYGGFMLALQITSTRQFMNHLLTDDCFSSFLLETATVTTFNTFHIDGRIHPEFYDNNSDDYTSKTEYTFSKYLDLQEHLFFIIKGSRTPLSMKLTLRLNPESMEKLLLSGDCNIPKEVLSGFILNIKYDGEKIMLTTAISYEGFTMDKSAEPIWDKALKKFLSVKEIAFEEIA